MFARNALIAFAMCATTVLAVPISVSSSISSATPTSNTQLLSSATPYAPSSASIAETALPSATDNDFHASGLGPIFRDGKIVSDERVPAPLGLVHPPPPFVMPDVMHKGLAMAPRAAKGADNKRWIVDGVLSEGHINNAFSDAGLDIAIDDLMLGEELDAILSKLAPEQLHTLLSIDVVAALLSKMEKVHVGTLSSASADHEATAASALASPTSATPTKAARGNVPSSR